MITAIGAYSANLRSSSYFIYEIGPQEHQHAPLPLERLKDVPLPVLVLLEKLLEKDPAQRFQTPNDLLKVMPTISGAIDTRRRITRQSQQKTPSVAFGAGARRPAERLGPERISVAKLPVTGSDPQLLSFSA